PRTRHSPDRRGPAQPADLRGHPHRRRRPSLHPGSARGRARGCVRTLTGYSGGMGYDIGSVQAGQQPVEGVAARALFARVMLLVAVTCGFAALGAYAGRNLTGFQFIIPWIGAIACIFGLNMANARGQTGIALALLFAMGFLLGLAVGVTVVWYAENEPTVVWQAAGATGLTVAGMGTWGYATRRDLSYL